MDKEVISYSTMDKKKTRLLINIKQVLKIGKHSEETNVYEKKP